MWDLRTYPKPPGCEPWECCWFIKHCRYDDLPVCDALHPGNREPLELFHRSTMRVSRLWAKPAALEVQTCSKYVEAHETSELHLNAALEELRVAFEIESVKASITIGHL